METLNDKEQAIREARKRHDDYMQELFDMLRCEEITQVEYDKEKEKSEEAYLKIENSFDD